MKASATRATQGCSSNQFTVQTATMPLGVQIRQSTEGQTALPLSESQLSLSHLRSGLRVRGYLPKVKEQRARYGSQWQWNLRYQRYENQPDDISMLMFIPLVNAIPRRLNEPFPTNRAATMSNPTPEGLPIESREPGSPSQSFRNKNQPQQQSHFSQFLPKLHPWRGIRQYTNQLSPQLANPEFIKRSRLIYNKLRPQLIKDYAGWYIAIEPDNGDYSLNTDKALAQQEVRQKHPQRLICTFQLMTTSAE